jgi:predicted O-methyltransferase YrrM
VHLVQGFIPESFKVSCPKKISFLHIDLNDAKSEINVLEELFDLVISGGIILFDDYGATGFSESKQLEDDWMRKRGYSITELPTGQGFVIKR